jgi:phage terminase Nu1 subunit (DNA packaging protein)
MAKEPTGAQADEAGTITTEVLARLLMVTPHWVRRLTNEGWIPRPARNRYRIAEGVQGYIRFLRDEQRRASKSASASRVQDARACEIELRTAREENRLIETEEAIAVCDEIVGAWRSALSGLPARITRNLELRRRIETEVDDICRSVADRLAERARALRACGEALAPDPEDDA